METLSISSIYLAQIQFARVCALHDCSASSKADAVHPCWSDCLLLLLPHEVAYPCHVRVTLWDAGTTNEVDHHDLVAEATLMLDADIDIGVNIDVDVNVHVTIDVDVDISSSTPTSMSTSTSMTLSTSTSTSC